MEITWRYRSNADGCRHASPITPLDTHGTQSPPSFIYRIDGQDFNSVVGRFAPIQTNDFDHTPIETTTKVCSLE